MKQTHFLTSACRYCRHYQPEGRRGGSCEMLGVPVESAWEACALASPVFETAIDTLEKSLEEILLLETSLKLDSFSEVPSRLTENYEQKTEIKVTKHSAA
ncbi:MAG: hypothetical protein ACFCU5_15785 [Pleurocapsa sp.]